MDAFKQESEHRNNARNRCIYTKAKAMGVVAGFEDINKAEDTSNTEERLIREIDNKLFKQANQLYDSRSGRRKRNSDTTDS